MMTATAEVAIPLGIEETAEESRRPTRNRPRRGGGGPDGGGHGDEGRDGDQDPAGRRQPELRRDRPAERQGEEIKIPSFPRSAADLRLWLELCHEHGHGLRSEPAHTSFEWIARTKDDDVDFEELGVAMPEFASLDAKLRTVLPKNVSSDAEKQQDLVNVILAKSDELKGAMPRRQIKGRQILLLI